MIRSSILVLLFPVLLLLGLWLGRGGFLQSGLMPPCLFHQWTGLHCPGCGGTRAFQALAQGDLGEALRMNPLGVVFMLSVALIVLRISWEAAFPEKRWPRIRFNGRLVWAVVLSMVAFAVLRNLPTWPFTLLAPY